MDKPPLTAVHPCGETNDVEAAQSLADLIESLLTSIAIVIAGLWGWFLFRAVSMVLA